MIKYKKPDRELSLDKMMDALHNLGKDKRSLAELDDVIDEILSRNPDFVQTIFEIVNKTANK